MYPRRMVTLFGLIGALVVPRASAQAPSVDSGSRIRVSLGSPGGGRLTGSVVALASDTLRFVPERRTDTVAVFTSTIRRLEVRRRRSALGGALVGGYFGMAVGGTTMIAVLAAGNCLIIDFTSPAPVHCPTDGTAYAVILGATATGAIIGSVVRGQRWVRVPLTRVHASLTPTGVRIAIGF